MLAEWLDPPPCKTCRAGETDKLIVPVNPAPLERHLVVAALAAGLDRLGDPGRGGGGGRLAAAHELHPLRDDLDHAALLAVLGLPVPRLQTALDHDRAALVEVLPAALCLLAPDHAGQEAGLFPLLPALGRVVAIDGQPEVGHRGAAGRVPELRGSREVADQEDSVETRHQETSSTAGVCGFGAERIRLRTGTRVVKCRSTCSLSVSRRSYSFLMVGSALPSMTA